LSEYFVKQKYHKITNFAIFLHDKNHQKQPTLYQISRHFLVTPRAGATRNHGTFLQKSRRKVEEITATSCGNHLEKLRKSPRKVEEIIKKNTVKMLNVGECR
jgi:hypothetical protein